jgi:peptide/histidine transporter 3/4
MHSCQRKKLLNIVDIFFKAIFVGKLMDDNLFYLQVRHGGISSLRVFFNWYYWCINGGSLIGIGALSYIEQDVGSGLGFPAAFGAATIALIIALLLMLIGRPAFIAHRPIGSSLLGSLLHMLREGIMGRCSSRPPVSIQRYK